MTRMTRRRTFLRALVALPAAALVASSTALAQAPDGMAKGTGLKIHDENERRFFADLLCMCGGCQRESLSECICGSADGYRDEVRGMMAEGLTQEQIKDAWRRRYGPQALAVPPNKGGSQLLYVAPLLLIAGMAGVVVTLLKRFRARDTDQIAAAGPPVAGKGRDAYDDKLDEELKQLDDE
jgi:cytochrome c-type biogenesis protein CcmH/NrfF